jgi:hypothetical protein
MGRASQIGQFKKSTNLTMLRVVDGCSGGSSREQTYLSRLDGSMMLASESSQQIRPWKNSLTAIVFSSDMPRDLRVIILRILKTNPQIATYYSWEVAKRAENMQFANRLI